MHCVSSLSKLKESHIINVQQLVNPKVTLNPGVPHWLIIMEFILEEEEIGVIVGQTVLVVSEILFSFYRGHP